MQSSTVAQEKKIIGSSIVHRIFLSIILFAFWMILSSMDSRFITYGILTAIITAWVSYPLLLVPNKEQTQWYFILWVNPLKLIFYFFWLMWQLILANIDVVQATVGADLKINPCVVKFIYRVSHPMGQVLLANSITLTPGTVTMNVTEDGFFEVHALTDGAAEGLKDGGMQKKVAWLLGEEYEFEVIGEDY